MISAKSKIIALAVLSALLIVLLLWMPKVPASKRNPENSAMNADSLKLLQAVELVNSENPMEGIQMLLQMVKEDSTNVQAQLYLAQFAVQSGQFDKALERFDLIARLEPENAMAHFEKGYVLMQMDSLNDALQSFDAGLKIAPDNLNGLFFSAQCYELSENWALAREKYMKVLELNTDTVIESKVNEFVQNLDKKLNP